jgi:ABC-type glycerol-3-phosphate transport system permease component
LPLSGPIIAVITLFYAVNHWNQFFNALVYIRRQELRPLQRRDDRDVEGISRTAQGKL